MAGRADLSRGRAELAQVRSESRGLFLAVGLFSMLVNLLMLTGPLFMLQVYDRVLGSRSESTLVALTLLMAFLFIMMGLLILRAAASLAASGRGFSPGWTGGCSKQRCARPPRTPTRTSEIT